MKGPELFVLDLDRLPDGVLRPEELPPEEQARRLRFHHQVDRDRFLAGRMLARAALARALGGVPGHLRFSISAAGRPELAGAPPFSVAHSGRLVVLAIGGALVGADVEAGSRLVDPDTLAASVLTQAERRALARAGDEAGRLRFFLRLWTLKEAYTKALGQGLLMDPKGFGFELDGTVRLATGGGGWHFAEYAPLPDYAMALAWQGDAARPEPLDGATLLQP